jgi:methyl-accepting chemotaxis protein
VQGATAGAVQEIETMVQVIKEVNDLVGTIVTAIQAHTSATQDIAGNIADASAGVSDANRRVGQTAAVSQNIAEEISGVSLTARDIAAASQQVQASAVELAQMAEELKEMLANYKV